MATTITKGYQTPRAPVPVDKIIAKGYTAAHKKNSRSKKFKKMKLDHAVRTSGYLPQDSSLQEEEQEV